ncbi:fertilization-influencing membrane protein isoform X1 [Hemicordylus capensis]|uniref:fertilization-influencing membrane protein isoform X1 n=1 Tax=Hemicordylus capensis TaxID=884348 RepID=UPI0023022369|nr:fertilization-influencing membrane protein isoform X1 [Hemicordylus capensis]
MLSHREFLLLQLLCTLTNLTEVLLTDPQLLTAPAEEWATAKTTVSSPHQQLWFDYPDSDREKILAVYKLIGEQPELIAPTTFPGLLRYILVGSVVLLVLFSLYQIISKVIFKASSPPATATEEKSGATP